MWIPLIPVLGTADAEVPSPAREQMPESQVDDVINQVLGRAKAIRPLLLADAPQADHREDSELRQWAAKLGHIGLYALLLALPLSGWLHDSAWKDAATHPMSLFGMVPWPRIGFIMDMEPGVKEQLHGLFGEVHEWLADVFYVLFALHVLGALKHQFLDRQKLLQRMWF